jgi:predicted Ser/Thr protein kinase
MNTRFQEEPDLINMESNEVNPRNAQLDRNSSVLGQALSNITVGKLIGTGSYSEVFRGDWQGTPVALKKLKATEHLFEFHKEANFLV